MYVQDVMCLPLFYPLDASVDWVMIEVKGRICDLYWHLRHTSTSPTQQHCGVTTSLHHQHNNDAVSPPVYITNTTTLWCHHQSTSPTQQHCGVTTSLHHQHNNDAVSPPVYITTLTTTAVSPPVYITNTTTLWCHHPVYITNTTTMWCHHQSTSLTQPHCGVTTSLHHQHNNTVMSLPVYITNTTILWCH
ncbi:hypothetical protein Btru_035141 [Bulinus truncatus]|nr:hypothetical protein Btru_035141 [Bulinus truncatus]